jgi:hypothetical protein
MFALLSDGCPNKPILNLVISFNNITYSWLERIAACPYDVETYQELSISPSIDE